MSRGFGRTLRGLVAGAVVLYACGGDGPTDPPGPRPGTLSVRLTAPLGAGDRALLLEIRGPGIQSVTAAGALELFEGGPGNPRKVILVGPLTTGSVLRVQVSDVGQLPLYSARVLDVAGSDYAPGDPSRYQAGFVEGP